MPYFTFRDREQSRPEIHGNWKAQLVAWLRKREKLPIKAESEGIALQSTASEFMASHRMMGKFRPLVIDSIKKYFRILSSDSDPTKPPVGQTLKPNSIRSELLQPNAQMAFDFHFESVFKKILNENTELFDQNGFSEELEGFIQYQIVPALFKTFGNDMDIDTVFNEFSLFLRNEPVNPEYKNVFNTFLQTILIPKLYERLKISPNSTTFRKAIAYIALSFNN